MSFTISIPSPETMRSGGEAYRIVPAGTELHRIHPSRFGAAAFNDTDRGDARFSPIRDASGAIIPTIYAAQTFASAVCEIILRCPDTPAVDPATGARPLVIVAPADYGQSAHSQLTTSADLNLIDLTVAGQRRIGIDHNALMAGPRSAYPETRDWAARLHLACPDAQGLYYSSYQWGPDFALVLFGDRCPAGSLQPVASRAVSGAPCHDAIVGLAESLGFDYLDI